MLTIFTLLCIAGVYGSGFDPPTGVTVPFGVVPGIVPFGVSRPFTLLRESPIQTRILASTTAVVYNCITVYKTTGLDIFTKKEPIVRADNDTINTYGNDQTYALCSVWANLILINYILPDANEALIQQYDDLGFNSSLTEIDPDVAACDITDSTCLEAAAAAGNYEPEIMGSIVAYQAIDFLENDGWNADGSINRDNDGQCTANCRPFSDTTGYEPEIGDFDRWQPLEENNGIGFFFKYDHVVPHVGFTGRTYYTPRSTLKSRSSSNPDYNYDDETALVVERMEDLASNETQKMIVEFFDNKIAVGGAVLFSLFAVLPWNYQEFIFWTTGFVITEYEAVIHAWREKRIWDLVRPTTLIKRGEAGNSLFTYGGPGDARLIDAEDFESYIRVMPHSEYPSGSGCICLAGAQFSEKFAIEKFNRSDSTDPIPISIPRPGSPFLQGSSSVEPGVTPSQDLFVTLGSLAEMNEVCGESRLWGGMHFTASIPGSQELCDGVGYDAYDFMANIEAGNIDAFTEFEDEEIADFEDEYCDELKSTLPTELYNERKEDFNCGTSSSSSSSSGSSSSSD